jgi:predicted ATPase/class 3 adenylate cyclase
MTDLPSGTVTMLFTDLESSTRLWEQHGDSMPDALARHDEILRSVIIEHGGQVVKTTGDGVHAVFARASDALSAAKTAQLAVERESWVVVGGLRVRIGIHTTEAALRDGDYFGSGVNRAARLMAIAHGGQVVCSQTTADLVRDQLENGMTLVDLGEHRLRDLSRAERVFQLTGAGLTADFPPLHSLDAYPSNLPAQLSTFIGRETEVAAVGDALRDARLVTLTGVGGVGKTRLALQAAGEMVQEFPGGAWVVELGGLTDALVLPETVASAMRIAPPPGTSIVEALTTALSEQPTLMVLDNCEHLLEGVAQFVGDMLRAAPDLRVLCTSREGLGLPGERIMAVQPLAVPSEQGAEDAADSDAVRLFVERAHGVRSSFALGDENVAAVVRICRRVDGIPLAIELAAARVRSMAPGEIATRLDQRFQLLSGGTRGAVNRHQTLRRAIDWSYELLAPEEAELLQRLSVCVAGFDLAAAEAIGTSDTIDALQVVDIVDRLVDKSLIDVEDVADATRYRLLETIREYAFERLETAGRTDEARARHAEHFTEIAERVGSGLRGSDERAWLERAERDLDNVRAAVIWSTERDGATLALRILMALALHGVRIEAGVCSWAASVAAAATPDDERYPVALAAAAWWLVRDGDVAGADRLGGEALAATTTDSPLSIEVRCRVYATTAAVEFYAGRTDVEQAEGWVECARRLDDAYEEALACTMVGVHRMFGGLEGAASAAEDGVRAARRCGSPTALAYSLLTLGQVVGFTDLARGIANLDEAIEWATVAANEFAVAAAAAARATILMHWGDNVEGCRAALESTRRALGAQGRTSFAQGLWAVGGYLAVAGQDEPAALLDGVARAVCGGFAGAGWAEELVEALAALPGRVGEKRYADLVAQGMAMSDEQLLDFATNAVDLMVAS